MKVRFVTEELGFETDEHCVQFLCEHGAERAFIEKDDGVRLATAQYVQIFENAKSAAFSKVDIKGQI